MPVIQKPPIQKFIQPKGQKFVSLTLETGEKWGEKI